MTASHLCVILAPTGAESVLQRVMFDLWCGSVEWRGGTVLFLHLDASQHMTCVHCGALALARARIRGALH